MEGPSLVIPPSFSNCYQEIFPHILPFVPLFGGITIYNVRILSLLVLTYISLVLFDPSHLQVHFLILLSSHFFLNAEVFPTSDPHDRDTNPEAVSVLHHSHW